MNTNISYVDCLAVPDFRELLVECADVLPKDEDFFKVVYDNIPEEVIYDYMENDIAQIYAAYCVYKRNERPWEMWRIEKGLKDAC